jgi:hypothetical protein
VLLTKTFIFSPAAAIQPDEYNFFLYFQEIGKAKYLNIGDVVEDTIGNQYEIVNAILTFADGGQVTAKAIVNNVLPVEDSDYDSKFFTPDQTNYWPEIRSAGQVTFAQLYSPEDYEYSASATWDDSAEANKAEVGTSIVDSNGKEFEISYLDPVNRFNVQFRVVESHRTGNELSTGSASLFAKTDVLGLFQGTELTDPARTIVQNRDSSIVEESIVQHDHDDIYYTQAEVDVIIAGIGGGTVKRNQIPVEAINGSLLIFTLPNSDTYASGTLTVLINGLRETDITELSVNTFQVASPAPEVGDTIRIDYVML